MMQAAPREKNVVPTIHPLKANPDAIDDGKDVSVKIRTPITSMKRPNVIVLNLPNLESAMTAIGRGLIAVEAQTQSCSAVAALCPIFKAPAG